MVRLFPHVDGRNGQSVQAQPASHRVRRRHAGRQTPVAARNLLPSRTWQAVEEDVILARLLALNGE